MRGQAKREDGLTLRRLEGDPGLQAAEESAAHEIAETFSTTAKKLPRTNRPAMSYNGKESDKEKNSGKDKSDKGKVASPHTFAPKMPKGATAAPKGPSPSTPKQMYPPYPVKKAGSKKEGKNDGAKNGQAPKVGGKEVGKTDKNKDDHEDDYDYYDDYYNKGDKGSKKDSGTGKAPKGIKGEKGSKNGSNNKKGKVKDGKNDNEKGWKNKTPKFPGDDDYYYDDGDHQGGGETPDGSTSVPVNNSTMSPQEPQDGRKAADDDDYYDDGDVKGTDDEDSGQRGDTITGKCTGTIGIIHYECAPVLISYILNFAPFFVGDDNIPDLPDYTGGNGESSRALNIIIPVGSALGVLLLCCGCFFVRRNRRRERLPHSIRDIEAKIQHHAEEGTIDGTADLSDARTFTFSEDGIEKYKRLGMASKSDKSSTIDEELRDAMETLEDFEEVSLQEDDEENQRKQNSKSLVQQFSQRAFKAASTLGWYSNPVPVIEEAVSRDDSSTSDIYNNEESSDDEDEYESYNVSKDAQKSEEANLQVQSKPDDTSYNTKQRDSFNEEENKESRQNVVMQSETKNMSNDADVPEDEPTSPDAVPKADPIQQVESENELREDVIDLTTYVNEKATSGSSALEPPGLEPGGIVPEEEIADSSQDSSSKKVAPVEPTLIPVESALMESAVSPESSDGEEIQAEIDDEKHSEESDVKPCTSDVKETAPSTSAGTTELAQAPDEAQEATTEQREAPKLKVETHSKTVGGAPATNGDSRPEWMKKTLRSQTPTNPVSQPPKANEEKVPEWMLKYKQMKFQKPE